MSRAVPSLMLVSALLAPGVGKGSFFSTPVLAAPPVYTSVYDTVGPRHDNAFGIVAEAGKLRLLTSTASWVATLFSPTMEVRYTALPPYPPNLRIDDSSPAAFNRAAPGTYVYYVGFRGAVFIWNTATNTADMSVGIGQSGTVHRLAVGDDGRLYGSTPTELRLIDPLTSAPLLIFGNGGRGLTVGPDGDIYVLDAAGTQIQRFNSDGTLDLTFSLTTPMDPDGLAVGPDGRLYLGDGVGGGAVYDTDSGALLATLEAATSTTQGSAGRTSLTLDDDGYLYLWDAPTGLHVFDVPDRTITVPIQIKKGPEPARIKLKEKGPIHVTIFSTPDFNPATDLDLSSLTFGRTGSEQSFDKCAEPEKGEKKGGKKADKKGDKAASVECTFHGSLTGFVVGDTAATLEGRTTAAMGGVPVTGTVPIVVVR